MQKIVNYKVISNKALNHNTYLMELKGPSSWCKPGKFVNISIPGFYLKRPMSVYDWTNSSIKVVYRLIGKGTKHLSKIKVGSGLEILIDLGNSYIPYKNKEQLIVCGGVGIGSVYRLAKQLKQLNKKVTLIFGFKSKSDYFELKEVKNICDKLIITTDDGSIGFKGNVVDAMKKYNLIHLPYYTCGSMGLMNAVFKNSTSKDGQLSLECRMGCGFGCCMGCSINTKNGPKRICKDGSIFKAKELLW